MFKLDLATLAGKLILGAIVVILLLGFLQVRSCQSARQAEAQSKLDKGQAGAFTNSAVDAINVQATANERERVGDDLTRSNERDIRNAQGSDARVDPAARDAGLLALCRRPSYRGTERCRVLLAHPQ